MKHKGVCSEHCRLRTCFHRDAYLQFAVALKPDRFPVFHLSVLAKCAAPLSLPVCFCAEEQ